MKAYRQEVYMKDDTRLALLEQTISHINESLVRIEKRFDKLDAKIEKSDTEIRSDIADVRKNSWSQFRWVMGSILALFGTIVTVLIKGHVS